MISYFRKRARPDIGVTKMCQNRGILILAQGPERGSPGLMANWPRSPLGRPEIAGQSLEIKIALFPGPNHVNFRPSSHPILSRPITLRFIYLYFTRLLILPYIRPYVFFVSPQPFLLSPVKRKERRKNRGRNEKKKYGK